MGRDSLQGALDLLILQVLARGAEHGYGIMVKLQQLSQDLLRVEEGSLYPALQRMQQAGWLKPEWKTTDHHRRAKYYQLTPLGRKRLAQEQAHWDRVSQGIALVLRNA